ncbi:MAG: ComEC/Rec2 family competence protein [Candidatus Moranbacteria bacterium]|nr:ComEC/Rec2 family competence protein [Candidatus Moranbacteria bacterium]
MGSFLDWNAALVFTLVCVGTMLAAGIVFWKEHIMSVVWIGACVATGTSIAAHSVKHYQVLDEEREVQGIGRVRGEMLRGVFDARFVLEPHNCEGRVCPQDSVLVKTSLYETFTDGMSVRFGPCDLKRPEQFDPRFDYLMYLAKEGIGFVAHGCSVEPSPARGDWLRGKLHDTRVFISSVIGKRIPEPEAGLARGLLLGGSDELPESLTLDFRTVGLSHIVAVSGYNISVLAGGFFLLGIGLGWYRKRAIWIAFVGTVLFVLLVGAPASAVRAALVAIAGFGAFAISRPIPTVSVLCFAAALMLLGNPLLLRYDIGFQLSFLATFAILFSAPWRSRFGGKSWFVGGFIDVSLITLSVLFFVTPLTLIHFGTLSPYALFANMLVLPLVPVAFIVSLGVVIFGWVPGIGALLGWIAYGTLHGLIAIVEMIARIPGATASYGHVEWWFVVVWYGCCLSFLFWQHRVVRKAWEREALSVYTGGI